jgi:ABC-type antimicrobial peptide transport system permease subunit
VALISETVAREFFGDADPLGQPLSAVVAGTNLEQRPSTIIGVVAEALLRPLRSEVTGTIYRPMSLTRSNPPVFLVRTASPGIAARQVSEALRRVDARVRTTPTVVRERLEAFLSTKRMMVWLVTPLAALVLVLAVFGVFGVTAFVVGQRSKEVSLRVAIGGSPARIVRMLIRDSLRPVLIGLVIGLAAALAVSQWATEELPGVSPFDPLSIGIATATLVAGALAAVVIPAQRAAKTDPSTLLRQI